MRSKRIAALVVSMAMAPGPAVAAGASEHQGPPDHVLRRAHEAIATARELATQFAAVAVGRDGETGMPDHAQGKVDHATGLLRAMEVLEAAAARASGRGNAFGRGHAARVHAILLGEGSPSQLAGHGRRVSAMVEAYNSLKADRPGRGLGRSKSGGEDGG